MAKNNPKSQVKKVVLAYSGGLDTSVIVPWLHENYGCEVICYTADVGQGEELTGLPAKAKASGASKIYIEDLTEEFASHYLFKLLKSGAIYERNYLLGTSIARPLIAKHMVDVAHIEGADAVAHGCTGKGNDQVRFEVSFFVLAPDLTVLAPIRDANIPREKALALAGEWGIPIASVVATYSVDENIWGRTAECGPLEDPWVAPPEDAFERTKPPHERPSEPAEVVVAFDRGVPIALDGETWALPEIIRRLDALGGSYGFGRVDMIENRRVGIKSRELYEVPGALSLIVAHQALEDMTLERDLAHHKPVLEQRWADLVYDGQWFSPLREAIDAYVEATQRSVTGDVRLRYEPGSCTVVGRRAEKSLYDLSLATYGSEDAFDQSHAEGYVRLYGLPLKVWAAKQGH